MRNKSTALKSLLPNYQGGDRTNHSHHLEKKNLIPGDTTTPHLDASHVHQSQSLDAMLIAARHQLQQSLESYGNEVLRKPLVERTTRVAAPAGGTSLAVLSQSLASDCDGTAREVPPTGTNGICQWYLHMSSPREKKDPREKEDQLRHDKTYVQSFEKEDQLQHDQTCVKEREGQLLNDQSCAKSFEEEDQFRNYKTYLQDLIFAIHENSAELGVNVSNVVDHCFTTDDASSETGDIQEELMSHVQGFRCALRLLQVHYPCVCVCVCVRARGWNERET